ncbi:MAG TPA: hypothetical protein VM737_05765 [Gemmatimonadota bacterium]|nr:hypothetical protein [Gemmatimonadota bacterium]
MSERKEKLAVYSRCSAEEYLADEEGVLASKYLLLTAIEDVLAIANHIVASEGYRSPSPSWGQENRAIARTAYPDGRTLASKSK